MPDSFAGVDPFVPQAPASAPRPTPDVFTPPPEPPMRELADTTATVFAASRRHLSTAKRVANEVRLEWSPAEGEVHSVPMPVPSSPGPAAFASTQTPLSRSPATTAVDSSVSSSSRSLSAIAPESSSQRRVSRARVQEQDGGVRLAGGPLTSFVDALEDEDDDTRTQYSTLPPPYSDNFV